MPRHLVMLKLVRISGWVLLALMVVQFTTVAIFEGLAPPEWLKTAAEVHEFTGLLIGGVALVHVVPAVYLAVRRWTRKRAQPQT